MGKFKEKGYFIQRLAAISIVMLGIGGVQSASAGLDDGQINLEARLNQDYGDGSGKAMFVAQDYRDCLSIEIEKKCMKDPKFPTQAKHHEEVFDYLKNKKATRKEIQAVREAWNIYRKLGKVKSTSLSILRTKI